MGVSKVIYGGNPIIDISDSTVTAESLEEGKIAYGANGERITGTAELKNQNNIDIHYSNDYKYPELIGFTGTIKIYGKHRDRFHHYFGNSARAAGISGVPIVDITYEVDSDGYIIAKNGYASERDLGDSSASKYVYYTFDCGDASFGYFDKHGTLITHHGGPEAIVICEHSFEPTVNNNANGYIVKEYSDQIIINNFNSSFDLSEIFGSIHYTSKNGNFFYTYTLTVGYSFIGDSYEVTSSGIFVKDGSTTQHITLTEKNKSDYVEHFSFINDVPIEGTTFSIDDITISDNGTVSGLPTIYGKCDICNLLFVQK